MAAPWVALLLALGAATAAAQPSAAPSPGLQPATASYTLNVTLGVRSPDCFSRPVILVNGAFMNTTIEVVQGQTLEVTVHNDLPDDYPVVTDGITIHWHGLNQRGSQYMDGVAYISSCPIARGTSFTYRFPVPDMPGTYAWHGHAGMEALDGLRGPLIVRPAGPDALAGQFDEERTVQLTDWYHDLYGPLAYANARPVDNSKVTNASGKRAWVDLPQSVLINGQGFAGDCALGPGGNSQPIACNVTAAVVPPGRSAQNPQATQSNQGCRHFNLTVEPGKRYRLRLINLSSLLMLSFVVEGHNLTIVAADAVPVEPLSVASVDVNSGQRYDVILTANAEPRTYYMTAQGQYRPGSPAGFGFLTYANSNISALPPTPTPASNGTAPWSLAATLAVKAAASLMAPANGSVAANSLSDASRALSVPQNATVSVLLNTSQPVTQNGQLHWAFNNVATYKTPACAPLLRQLAGASSSYLQANGVPAGSPQPDISFQQTATPGDKPQVYVYGQPGSVLNSPVAGQFIVPLTKGAIVEVILQNNPSNFSNGDQYLASADPGIIAGRGGQEQHPVHLHGHHFWVVGLGDGNWNASSVASYNLQNPAFRDTVTVPRGGWAALRFIADNPGAWQLHCHLTVHLYMGQQIIFAEAAEEIPQPPPGLPACPTACAANFAGWGPGYVDSLYGNSGLM